MPPGAPLRTVRLFPLPQVVLFPGTVLPLHVFEPRYRALAKEALAGDKTIGIVLLRRGWERDYEGSPPLHAVGCEGRIITSQALPEGKWNLILLGTRRFRIERILQERPFRKGAARLLPEPPMAPATEAELRARLSDLISEMEASGTFALKPAERVSLEAIPPSALVDLLAFFLALAPEEKQEILEEPRVPHRLFRLLLTVRNRRKLAALVRREGLPIAAEGGPGPELSG